jgi:hypothetical protein
MDKLIIFLIGLGTGCFPPILQNTFMVDDAIEWIANTEDNICGVSDLRMVKQPGIVDWNALMDSTAEMRKIKREKIKKDSPAGVTLIAKAEEKCMKACLKQMRKTKVDSMWKNISHSSKLPWEQTDSVIDLIKNAEKKKVLVGWRERR